MVYFKVNAPSDRIFLKISSSLLVKECTEVNPNYSRAMSALTFLLFKLNTLQKNPQS